MSELCYERIEASFTWPRGKGPTSLQGVVENKAHKHIIEEINGQLSVN